ncbi:hypothetical protein GGS23DRAFT_554347 [Durotheca rogersii]|uniref:uncharacterized protein n=1 Tax=Durotheca rogersii TaxID=419775 RepID=UPI00221FA41E|nr:uncharacterized protein GGS23DRAFT_554347 [Durotheca rogersii]KAI5865858.1 hypothetical protein GGS23DRAFT_554347 [Durotheca rogersii]
MASDQLPLRVPRTRASIYGKHTRIRPGFLSTRASRTRLARRRCLERAKHAFRTTDGIGLPCNIQPGAARRRPPQSRRVEGGTIVTTPFRHTSAEYIASPLPGIAISNSREHTIALPSSLLAAPLAVLQLRISPHVSILPSHALPRNPATRLWPIRGTKTRMRLETDVERRGCTSCPRPARRKWIRQVTSSHFYRKGATLRWLDRGVDLFSGSLCSGLTPWK